MTGGGVDLDSRSTAFGKDGVGTKPGFGLSGMRERRRGAQNGIIGDILTFETSFELGQIGDDDDAM